jgi:predicted O-linked N-acetylglucosamine transferase (SPINDLY family)
LLGRAQKAAGDLDAAIASYRRAVLRDGRLVEAHVSLGVALRARGDSEEAARSYHRALSLNPDSFEANLNLATLAESAGRYAEAVDHFERAERSRAVSGETHQRHGKALWQLGRKSEAADQLERALTRDPDLLEAHLNLGGMLQAMAQFDGARTHYGALINRLDSGTGRPTDAAARSALRREARFGFIETLVGGSRLDEALAMIDAEIRSAGDTLDLVDRLYWIAPYRFASQADLVALRGRFRRVSPTADQQPLDLELRPAAPQRLRIGYLSADFREHSVAYFIEPLLACHDPARFTVVCYSSNEKDDEVTARLRHYGAEWVEAKELTNRQLAERVAADGIDVLVDLSGRTQGARPGVVALRPACLQLGYLGYPTFTGFEQLDFRVTDCVIDPVDEDIGLTSERPLRLPRPMFCYRPPARTPDPVSSASTGRTVRFGSFNQAPKLSPGTVRTWAAILRQVPRSVLVLKAYAFDDAGTREWARQIFVAAGVGEEQLEIRPSEKAKYDHFAAYHDIDLALDTFPYNGATTTCEALWMGVPVITLAGETHAQRVGASLLGALGLDELVTRSEDDYVRVAVELAADASRRAELRSGLRERFANSSLRDEQGFTRSFETAVRQAWCERWIELRARPPARPENHVDAAS